eukprot:gene1364-4539_t
MEEQSHLTKTVSALNEYSPKLLVGCSLIYLLKERSFEAGSLIVGSLLSVSFGKLVKATLDVPRPHTSKKSSPGMPSTHAIAWTYFAVAVHSFARNNREHTMAQVLVGGTIGAAFALNWTQLRGTLF